MSRLPSPMIGLMPLALRAQKLMDQAEMLSDLALDVASQAGRERDANVISAEATRRRREAEAISGEIASHFAANT